MLRGQQVQGGALWSFWFLLTDFIFRALLGVRKHSVPTRPALPLTLLPHVHMVHLPPLTTSHCHYQASLGSPLVLDTMGLAGQRDKDMSA